MNALVLSGVFLKEKRPLHIIKLSSDFFGVPYSDVNKITRKTNYTNNRLVSAYLIHESTRLLNKDIAVFFSGRVQWTSQSVSYAKKKINELILSKDEQTIAAIKYVEDKIKDINSLPFDIQPPPKYSTRIAIRVVKNKDDYREDRIKRMAQIKSLKIKLREVQKEKDKLEKQKAKLEKMASSFHDKFEQTKKILQTLKFLK